MIWIQLVGIAALLLDVGSLQLKHRKYILATQILASLTWVGHFLLLGATAGAGMNAVGVVRSVSYYAFPGKNRPWWLVWAIVVLSCLVTIVLWQGPVSLLPMAAMILAAIAFWQRSEQAIRLLLLLCVPLWFTYNVIFHSYAGMLSDAVACASALVALYRYRHQGFKPASPR